MQGWRDARGAMRTAAIGCPWLPWLPGAATHRQQGAYEGGGHEGALGPARAILHIAINSSVLPCIHPPLIKVHKKVPSPVHHPDGLGMIGLAEVEAKRSGQAGGCSTRGQWGRGATPAKVPYATNSPPLTWLLQVWWHA